MNNRKKLDSILSEIYSRTESARTKQDLIDAINLLKHFSVQSQHKSRIIRIAAICIITIAILFTPIILNNYFGNTVIRYIQILLSLLLIPLLPVTSNYSLENISNTIHLKNFLLENDLKESPFEPRMKMLLLQTTFKQFLGTGRKQTMVSWLDGVYKGAEHTFDFNYFHCYSEVAIPSQDQGIPVDRYGIMMKFNFASQIYIGNKRQGFYPHKWTPSSTNFNEHYIVEANSKHDAAKFLTPFVLEEILKLGRKVPCIALEFSSHGTLCISFDQKSIVPATRLHSLENPINFAREIKHSGKSFIFQTLINFIHTLMKYSDNNFDKNIHTKTGST